MVKQNLVKSTWGYNLHNPILDLDECKRNNGGCEHSCHNYEGGYWCSCKDGYKLKDDEHGCEGKILNYQNCKFFHRM